MDIYEKESVLKKVRPFLHLNISMKILRFTGSWPPLESGFVRFLFFTYSFCFSVFSLGMYLFVEFVNLVINYNNVAKIASGAPLFITNTLYAYKFILILRRQRRIQSLISVVESPLFFKNNSRSKKIISWYTWKGIFHHTVYQIFGIIAITFYACIPISVLLKTGEKRLALDGWYPFDTTESYAFFLTWAYQVVAILMCCINNTAIDAFIAGLINVASCQFELLKWNIAAIGNDSEIEKLSINSIKRDVLNFHDKSISEELRNCIEHNLAIFSFVKEIQNIFGTVIGLQLIVNSLVICLSTYYVSQLTVFVPAEIIGNVGYALGIAYQIFIYCWNGNELYLQNENLGTFIYMGNWWMFSSRQKRDLQIVMLRSCRPLILSAIFLVKLIVPTFMSIIQTSYSMFTLLHKRSNK